MGAAKPPCEACKDAERRMTYEALADVDAGRVIDHQAVQAWAESLCSAAPLPAPRILSCKVGPN